MHSLRLIAFLISAVSLSPGCGGSPENLTISKNNTASYYESGAYERDLRSVLEEAYTYIENAEWSDSSAVIFDVDETALNNYNAIKSVDFGYWPPQWDEWILESAAPAVKPVLEFYKYVISKNFRVIFLTGREAAHYPATLKNLENEGYTKFDTLIVRGGADKNSSAVEFKSGVRRELNSAGYHIIATVGDQPSDLKGSNTGVKIKLPNYLYLVE